MGGWDGWKGGRKGGIRQEVLMGDCRSQGKAEHPHLGTAGTWG